MNLTSFLTSFFAHTTTEIHDYPRSSTPVSDNHRMPLNELISLRSLVQSQSLLPDIDADIFTTKTNFDIHFDILFSNVSHCQ